MEVDIFIAGIAFFVVTMGFTLLYVQRANMLRKLKTISFEAEAHHQASYGMAKHLRYLQLQNEKFQVEGLADKLQLDPIAESDGRRQADPLERSKDNSANRNPDKYRYRDERANDSVNNNVTTADIVDFRSADVNTSENGSQSVVGQDGILDSAVERLFSEGADVRKISEALSVSRTEAEIIAHIGPQNRNRA